MSPKAVLLVLIFVALVLPAAAVSQLSDSFVFIDAPSEVQMPAGSSATADVTVQNIGDVSNTVELEIETTAPVSASVVPGSLTLERGESSTFSVSFLASSADLVNRYGSKFRLKGKGVDLEKNFAIALLPTLEKKAEISRNYLVLLNIYESLGKRFEQVKGTGCILVEAGDLTAITPSKIVDELQGLGGFLKSADAALKGDDFVTAKIEEDHAEGLSSKIETDINSLKTSQESCEDEKSRVSSYLTGGAIGTTLGIVVIVVVLGLATWRHYKNAPRVRRLIRTPGYSVGSKPQEQQPSGIKRAERDFRYEFRKKK